MRRMRGENLSTYCKQYLPQAMTLDALRLHSVFEMESDSVYEMGQLSADGVLLIYGVSGVGTLTMDGLEMTLHEQTITIVPAKTVIEIRCEDPSKPIRCAGMLFSVLNVTGSHIPLLMFYNSVRTPLTASCSSGVNDIFSHLLGELILPQSSLMIVSGFVNQILVTAYRSFASHEMIHDEEEHHINAVGHTVYAIIRYVDDNLFAMNNLMDMAKELGYSYNYLSHLFRRKTGMTIQSYVSRKKIEKSIELLSDESLSVTEIASVLNYDCIQSFSKAFRRAMDMSPTEYRTAHGLASNE